MYKFEVDVWFRMRNLVVSAQTFRENAFSINVPSMFHKSSSVALFQNVQMCCCLSKLRLQKSTKEHWTHFLACFHHTLGFCLSQDGNVFSELGMTTLSAHTIVPWVQRGGDEESRHI